MLRRTMPLLALLLAVWASPVAAQEAAPAAAGDMADAAQMSLRPGDLIRVQVYREPDLDGEYLVSEAGTVVLPLIGEHQVAGFPLNEVRERLIELYRRQLRNPSIVITPLRRVNVLGEVQRPGMYAVDPTISLVGAVALAGGATSAGDLRRIRVIRDGRVYRERVGQGESLSSAGVHSGDEIIVDRRSWFERNSTFVVSTTLSITSIVIALLRRN